MLLFPAHPLTQIPRPLGEPSNHFNPLTLCSLGPLQWINRRFWVNLGPGTNHERHEKHETEMSWQTNSLTRWLNILSAPPSFLFRVVRVFRGSICLL